MHFFRANKGMGDISVLPHEMENDGRYRGAMNAAAIHRPESKVRNTRRDFILGLSTLLTIVAIYNLIYFNRYFPLSEGWFSVYARYILRGSIPYRDFQLALTPLYPLKIAALIHFFGRDFIVLRIFGILLILGMSSVLFALLSRVFPVYIASFISIVSIMYYQSGVAHITYDFIHFVTTYSLLSTYFVCKYVESDDHSFKTRKGLRTNIFLLLAGSFGAFAFLTKQSNGFVLIAFTLLAIAITAYKRERGRLFSSGIVYCIGVLLPTSCVVIWLSSEGAFSPFIHQAVFEAGRSKGTLVPILFRWFPRLVTKENAIVSLAACLAVLALRYRKLTVSGWDELHLRQLRLPPNITALLFSAIFVLSLLCILGPLVSTRISAGILSPGCWAVFALYVTYHSIIVPSALSSVIFFCIYSFKALDGNRSCYDPVILFSASLGFLYGTATSGGISEAGAFLGFALLVAHLLSAKSSHNLGKVLCFFGGLILISFLAAQKYTQPYNWWGLTQPDIRTARQWADIKELQGFRLSKETLTVISTVDSLVQRYVKPGQSIFTFPNIPLFYYLTDRYPRTFAIVHWFDVVPDQLAVDDAQRLLEIPPKMIIQLDLPESTWRAHEQAFRAGFPSGQRMIAKAMESLTTDKKRYLLLKELPVPNDHVLRVWVNIDKET